MTRTIHTQAITAAAAVAAAGFTPCTASAFTSNGRAFAFSVESVGGFSASGPAFSVVVDASGDVTATGTPRS